MERVVNGRFAAAWDRVEVQPSDIPSQGWCVGKARESCEKTFDLCVDIGQFEHRDADDGVGSGGIGDELEANYTRP